VTAWTLADTSFLEVSGLRIRVRVAGDGPPLLLVMGLGANLDMWQPLIAGLGQRELIAFDAPGTGGSATPRLPMTMARHATLVTTLLDRLGFRTVDVLGVSWGGLLAQKLAIDHPDRVRRLVLAATMPGVGSVPGRPSALWRLMSPRRYYSSSHFERIAPGLYGGRARTHPEAITAALQHRLARPPSLTGYFAQVASTSTYSGFGSLHRVRAPTLVLAGDDDPLVHLVNARLLAWLLRHATVRIVKGGGHLFLLDGTPGVGETISDFLA
jgi:poly(3-hydroxyalkanoate) depolymerase